MCSTTQLLSWRAEGSFFGDDGVLSGDPMSTASVVSKEMVYVNSAQVYALCYLVCANNAPAAGPLD